jgi:hypothetical protein
VIADFPQLLGEGDTLDIPNATLGPDDVVSPGERFTTAIEICLAVLSRGTQGRFTFFVDITGARVLPGLVFVTSSIHRGDLAEGDGGLAGGDTICNNRARDAGLPGSYVAWLSCRTCGDGATQVDAIDRITDQAYVLVGSGAAVAASVADLTDGTLRTPITETEAGTPLAQHDLDVWTGSAPGPAVRFTCSDWSSRLQSSCDHISCESHSGIAGRGGPTDARWNVAFSVSCNGRLHLYCFEN